MHINDVVLYAADLSTFSSIWYWIAVAVSWAMVCHWILGVPFDIILYSNRYGAQAAADLEQLVQINVRRLTSIMDFAGIWVVGLAAFVLTAVGVIGFYYGLEFAQGVFLVAFPMVFVGLLNLHAARQMQMAMPKGKALSRRLFRLRIWIIVLAAISIFNTAIYGMYFNLSVPIGY